MTIDNTVTTAPITIDIADLTQLVLPKNSPNGVVIWKIAATVANTDETPVYSITSQNPAGAIGLKGNKMVIADTSAVDYATNTELTGKIQATVGSATATATFTISITDGAGIYIPDAEFKAVLLKNTALNTDEDKEEISVAEAQVYAGAIEVNNLGITDATGIEYFSNVTILNLRSNALKALNVSNNTALTYLNVERNDLTDIDVSDNTALSRLSVESNNLSDIDVSELVALTQLFVANNQLAAIDVSNNTALSVLWSRNNTLTRVNVANGHNDKLNNLDLRNNPNLTCVQVDKIPSSFPTGWQFDNSSVFQTDACK